MSSTPAIDVHAHCIPSEVTQTLRREDGKYGISATERDGRWHFDLLSGGQLGPVHPGLLDVPLRLAAMDAAGVDVQVLSSWIDLTAYALPEAHGARYARMFNETLAGLAAGHPDRFLALGTVPLQASDAGAAELVHAVEDLDMVGVEIATAVAGRDLDDAGLEPFWSTAEDLGCLVLLHPCDSLAGRGVNRHFLGNLVGNPAESTIAVGHLIFGGVLERHPGLKLCVVHGGGFAPYQVGRWDHAFHRDARGAARHLTRPPSQWLGELYHDTVLHSARSLRLLVDVVGADHVLLGSDHPFEMGDPVPLETLEGVPGLTAAERDLVRGGNALRLLGTPGLVTAAG